MSIFEIQEAARENNDLEGYAATMHDEFKVIMQGRCISLQIIIFSCHFLYFKY